MEENKKTTGKGKTNRNEQETSGKNEKKTKRNEKQWKNRKIKINDGKQ